MRRSSGHAGPSQRQLRVGELVRHALSDILARETLRDPDLEGRIITVSEVRLSPDLKAATVFVAPLGGGETAPVVAALTRCKKFLRGRLGQHLTMKFTPDLRFEADRSFDEAQRVDGLLRSDAVARDLAADEGHDGDKDGN